MKHFICNSTPFRMLVKADIPLPPIFDLRATSTFRASQNITPTRMAFSRLFKCAIENTISTLWLLRFFVIIKIQYRVLVVPSQLLI